MICPACTNPNEMAYTSLSHTFVCMETDCGFELDMDLEEALALLEPELELVCA